MKKTIAISKRGQHAPGSPIRSLVPFAQQAIKRGVHVHHLNIGDPDFSLPKPIKQSLSHLAKTIDRLPYPAFRGQPNLLAAWRAYFKGIKLPYEIFDEDLVVTAGASEAMVLAAAVLTDPGDEILTFEPFYAPYTAYGQFVSANVKAITLEAKDNFHLPAKKTIVKKITSKTKAIFFTNPNNPTGTVFSKEEMQTILDIAREYNLFVVSDETYRGMVFDKRESLSMLHIAKKEDLDRIVIVDSLSKRLNSCGARIGIIMSKNRAVADAAYQFTQAIPCPSYIEQEIIAPMLSDSLEYVRWLSQEYQKRRDVFIDTMEKFLGEKMHRPEGAFYIMLPLPVSDASAFAKWLLTDFSHIKETVMVTPGEGFYLTPGKGRNEIRIAYVVKEKELKKAAELLARAIQQYPKKI